MQPEWDVMLHTATKQMRSTMMIPHHLNPPKLHLPWLVRYSSNCLQGNLYEFHISTTAQVLSNTSTAQNFKRFKAHSIHHTCNDDLHTGACKLFPVLNSSTKHWVSWVIPLPSSAPIPWASRTTWKTRRRRPPAPEVPGPGGDGWDLWLDERQSAICTH